MSRVHLVGGGRDERLSTPLFAAFVADARKACGHAAPRIRVLLVMEPDDTESVPRYRRLLAAADATEVDVHAIAEGAQFAPGVLDGVDALVIGGGLTPAYADAVAPIAGDVVAGVMAGMPYLGFSAGAAIAASRAIVGGWLLDGVPVGDEEAGEEREELTVVTGLGLVPFAVDVHAAQWGTLTRLVAAVSADLVGEGFAIDEHTALIVDAGGDAPTLSGTGAAWHVRPGDAPTVSRRIAARADAVGPTRRHRTSA